MADKSSGERKKLSLSIEGKLSLKNSVNSKLSGSVTTNNRSGRNTVQVEVKRVKRHVIENKDPIKTQHDSNVNLSVKEITARSRQLKEGLAKTAAEAEINSFSNIENKNNFSKRIESNKQDTNLKRDIPSIDPNKNFDPKKNDKNEDVNKNAKKVFEKDIFKENTKKQNFNKGYEQKRQSKLTIARALDSENIRVRSLASIKRRREKARMQQSDTTTSVKQIREVTIPDTISVAELANRMSEKTADVVRELLKNGIMATATQVIDADTAELITTEFGHKVKRVSESDIEIDISKNKINPENLVKRPPVVTVMGHVDHGKTSLLELIKIDQSGCWRSWRYNTAHRCLPN